MSSKFLLLPLLGLLAYSSSSSLLTPANCEPHPWADNVCNKSVPVKKDIVVEHPVEYKIEVQSMCGLLACTKTRLETRQDQSIRTIVVHEERVTCCDGYAETPARQCAPICLESCGHSGKCVAPNVCKCAPEPTEWAPGFVGPTCKRFTCLAKQRWGSTCERECPLQCSGTSYCSADTGKCLCLPGWHGPECELECAPDSDADDCQEVNRLPAILEPDANVISSGAGRTQLHAQALVLDNAGNGSDAVEIVDTKPTTGQAWASFASSYLIGLLSLMSLVLLAAFLIVKRRYELVRNELYYASAASAVSSRSGNDRGPGSEYSGDSVSSSFYSTTRRVAPSSVVGDSDDLDKNLSFAAATRNILTGVIGGGGKRSSRATDTESNNKLLLFAPRIESHLISSMKQAQNNIYSEVDLNNKQPAPPTTCNVATRARAQTPTRLPAAANDDHIYSVPKSPTTTTAKPQDTSVEIGYEDSDSNIYEEIKPRASGGPVPK